jgi:hypothetical protein
MANSQGLIASTPAPQTTARRVTLNVWTEGSQTSVWAKTKLTVNRKQITADMEIKNKENFFIHFVILSDPARNATPVRQPDGSHSGGHNVAGGSEESLGIDEILRAMPSG